MSQKTSSAAHGLKFWLKRDQGPIFTAIAVVAMAAVAQSADRWEMAVYALSFWQYLVYALAFFWRQIPLERFIHDSVLLKGVSLAALALVLWTTVPSLMSVIVVTAGFALNMTAARALGADRTYYGFELAALPAKRITSFPYSLMSHPMLIGNVVAYGGTLLDAEFRQFWWPLALLHVLLNIFIILMEAYGGKSRFFGMLWPLAGLLLGSLLLLAGFMDQWRFALATIIIGLAFGAFLLRRYARPMNASLRRDDHERSR